MSSTAPAQPMPTPKTWRMSAPHVAKALTYIKHRGSVTADDLVAWDRTHGRKLFNWDDPEAAEDWRRQQARIFLNHFRAVFDGMRVRAFIHVTEDATAGIADSAYFTVETIAAHPGMRAQVIADITRRLHSLARELKLWKLTDEEQAVLFQRLADAIRDRVAHEAA